MMIPFLAVVKKELASVIRDRTIVISILIQLFFASFSSALLLGMLSLYDSDTIMQFGGPGIRVGMVSAAANPLEAYLSERGLEVIVFETVLDAENAFYQGGVHAYIAVPQNASDTAEIKLYLPDSDAVSSLIRMVIQEPLKRYENYLRAQNDIEVRYADLKGKPTTSYEFIYSVLLPMLMFFPAFVAGSMSIDSLTEELENNTLQTLLSTPLTVNGMVAAKIFSAVILSITQCAAWLILLQRNGIDLQNTAWILLLALIVSGITSTSGTLAAVLLKDRERSQFIYSLALLAAAAISTLLNVSPITTLSRLAIGDYYTNGWHVMVFGAFLAGLYLLLLKFSRRLIV
ncbi:MAG: ABC transporter permease [Anaerolineae bacterium]|nr:ABC transporter permease [Anaerolineae bacterium]